MLILGTDRSKLWPPLLLECGLVEDVIPPLKTW